MLIASSIVILLFRFSFYIGRWSIQMERVQYRLTFIVICVPVSHKKSVYGGFIMGGVIKVERFGSSKGFIFWRYREQ